MECPIPQGIIRQLMAAAKYSCNELCGLVDSESKVHYISNVSSSPSGAFILDKREYFTLLKTISRGGLSVLCIFHTHPGGCTEPSDADLRSVRQTRISSLIVTSNSYRWIPYAND